MLMCTKENLLRGLSSVERAITRSPSLPILSYVILQPVTGKLHLRATDLDIAIIARIPAKTETNEPFALPLRILLGFVNAITEENITFQKKGKNISLSAGAFQSTIQHGPLDDFPIIPELDEKNTIRFSGTKLAEAFQQTAIAAALTDSRPELTGIFFRFDGDTITIAATDTFRLAFRVLQAPESNEFSLILPYRTAREVVRLFGNQPIELSFTQNQCSFSSQDTTLISRLIEGTFPDFKAIIPTNHLASCAIPKAELLQKSEGASFFTGRLNDVRLSLDAKQKTLSLSTENPDVGSYKTTLDAQEQSGENQDVAVNLKYFLDGVRGISGEAIRLQFNGDTKPIVLRNANEGLLEQYLLMPIRKQ